MGVNCFALKFFISSQTTLEWASRTTAEHPLWVAGRGWTPAGEVAVGDGLVGHDGGVTRVDGVEAGGWQAVYNLRVADYHTYFVGGDEWGFSLWAHNQCHFGAIDDLVEGGSSAVNTMRLKNMTGSQIKERLNAIFKRDPRMAGPNEAKHGVVYVLRDAKTGEILKVGQADTAAALGRFKSYKAGMASLGKRGEAADVVVDFVRLEATTKQQPLITAAEDAMRAAYGGPRPKMLLWDNTKTRLNVEGPGEPWKNPDVLNNWKTNRTSPWEFADGGGI